MLLKHLEQGDKKHENLSFVSIYIFDFVSLFFNTAMYINETLSL